MSVYITLFLDRRINRRTDGRTSILSPLFFFNLFFSSLLFFFSFSSLLRVLSRIFNLFFKYTHTSSVYLFLPLSRYLPTGELIFLSFFFSGYYYVTWTPYQKKNHISSIIVVVVFSQNHFDWFCVVHLFYACEEKPCDHVVFSCLIFYSLCCFRFCVLCVLDSGSSNSSGRAQQHTNTAT